MTQNSYKKEYYPQRGDVLLFGLIHIVVLDVDVITHYKNKLRKTKRYWVQYGDSSGSVGDLFLSDFMREMDLGRIIYIRTDKHVAKEFDAWITKIGRTGK